MQRKEDLLKERSTLFIDFGQVDYPERYHEIQAELLQIENKMQNSCDECKGYGKFWPEGTIGYDRCKKCEGRGYLL